VGPSPSSGFHFMSYDGQLNDIDYDTVYTKNQGLDYYGRGDAFDSSFYEFYTPKGAGAVVYSQQIKDKNILNYKRNKNLIKKLDRIQSISYDIQVSRTNPSQLNKKGTIGEVIIEPPVVSLDFEYLINGIRNEHRLGFNVNYPMFFYPFNGHPYYSGNQVFLFSGMTSKVLRHEPQHERGENYSITKFSSTSSPTATGISWQQSVPIPIDYNDQDERAARYCIPDNAPQYPFAYTDTHNFFVNISPNGVDEKSGVVFEEDLEHPFYKSMFQHSEAGSNEVLAIGDCRLQSYSCGAAVGDFPKARLTYLGSNISYHSSASGENIPAVFPKDGELMTGKFVIPESFEDGGVAALRPGDITLDLEASYLGHEITGINIDSYSFSIGFERNVLRNLGYARPIDLPINFPIYCQGSFSILASDYSTGSYVDLIREDSLINLSINVAAPECNRGLDALKKGVFYPGIPTGSTYNILNYTVKKARVTQIAHRSSIGQNKKMDVSFSVEMTPEDLTKGFFISGVNNSERYFDYLACENVGGTESGDGLFLVTEDWQPLIAGWTDV